MGKLLKKIIATLTLNSPVRLRGGASHFLDSAYQESRSWSYIFFLSYFLQSKARDVEQAFDEALAVSQVQREQIVAFLEKHIRAYENLSFNKEYRHDVEKLTLLNISLSARNMTGEISPAVLTRSITFPSSPVQAKETTSTVTVSVEDTVSTNEALMFLNLARTIQVTNTDEVYIKGPNEAKCFSLTDPGTCLVSIPLAGEKLLVPLVLTYPTDNVSVTANNNFVIPIHPQAEEIERNAINIVKNLGLSVPNEEMDKLFSTEEGRAAFIQKLKGKVPNSVPSKEDIVQLYSKKFLKKMEESKFSYLISFAQATESYLDGSERAQKALNCITAYLISMFLADDKAEEISDARELRRQNKKIIDILSGANDQHLAAIVKGEGPEIFRYPEYISTAYVRSLILELYEIAPDRKAYVGNEIAEMSRLFKIYSDQVEVADSSKRSEILAKKRSVEDALFSLADEKKTLDEKYEKLAKDLRPFITTYVVQLDNIVKENEVRNLASFKSGLFTKFEHTRKLTTGDRAMIALAGVFIDAMSFYRYEDRPPLAALVPEFKDACSLAIGFANEVESIGKELKSVGILSVDLDKSIPQLSVDVQNLLKKTCNGIFILAFEEGITIKEAIYSMTLKALHYSQRAYEIGAELLELPDSDLNKQEKELVAIHLRWIPANSLWASFTERYGINSDVYPLSYWENIAKFELDLIRVSKKKSPELELVASPPIVPKLHLGRDLSIHLPEAFDRARITEYFTRFPPRVA